MPNDFVTREISGADVRRFKDAAEVSGAVRDGKVDAAILDIKSADGVVANSGGRLKQLPDPITQEYISMAVAKGNAELLAVINELIDTVFANGTVSELLQTHKAPTVSNVSYAAADTGIESILLSANPMNNPHVIRVDMDGDYYKESYAYIGNGVIGYYNREREQYMERLNLGGDSYSGFDVMLYDYDLDGHFESARRESPTGADWLSKKGFTVPEEELKALHAEKEAATELQRKAQEESERIRAEQEAAQAESDAIQAQNNAKTDTMKNWRNEGRSSFFTSDTYGRTQYSIIGEDGYIKAISIYQDDGYKNNASYYQINYHEGDDSYDGYGDGYMLGYADGHFDGIFANGSGMFTQEVNEYGVLLAGTGFNMTFGRYNGIRYGNGFDGYIQAYTDGANDGYTDGYTDGSYRSVNTDQ
jgi:hypothetical protein